MLGLLCGWWAAGVGGGGGWRGWVAGVGGGGRGGSMISHVCDVWLYSRRQARMHRPFSRCTNGNRFRFSLFFVFVRRTSFDDVRYSSRQPAVDPGETMRQPAVDIPKVMLSDNLIRCPERLPRPEERCRFPLSYDSCSFDDIRSTLFVILLVNLQLTQARRRVNE
jgi:hypothetical protein